MTTPSPLPLDADISTGDTGHIQMHEDLSHYVNQFGTAAVFSVVGALTVKVGPHRFYADRALTITGVRASVGTAPTGASVICDVNKNGTTIFTTQANRPAIAVSTNTATAAPDITILAAGDYLTVDIDQIGSTVAGSDLSAQIYLQAS